jgi:hypothetical protein
VNELEQRLQRIDPFPASVPVDPADGPRARALREQIMTTRIADDPLPDAPPSHRRRWPLAAAAAGIAAAAALAVGIGLAARSDDAPEPVAATYTLTPSDPMAMCLAISEAPPPPEGAVAFGGTVTEVGADTVTLEVDQSFAGPEADTVTLTTGPDVTAVALDGVEFVPGQRYLVTVVDGQVQICGASGPATPELEAVYARWFTA